jgi:DNA-binding NarL/FixJ family response regulator
MEQASSSGTIRDMPGQQRSRALTEQQLDVLRLLATGLTDEAAATQLRCAPRTLRRRLAEAMEALGARSRLQAGFELCQQGFAASARQSGSGQAAMAGMRHPAGEPETHHHAGHRSTP